MINKKQAIEVFQDNGYSIKPLQFVCEKLSESVTNDGFVRFGNLTIEPASKDAVLTFQMYLLLKGNRINSLTMDTLTFFYSIYKTLLFDSWVYDGDSGATFAYFVGYKMKL